MAERGAQEALQLEKRLSLLSQSGRPGSGGRARAGREHPSGCWALRSICPQRGPCVGFAGLGAVEARPVCRAPGQAAPAPLPALSQGTTGACPVPPQRPVTRTSAAAAGSARGRSSPRPRPARRRRARDRRAPRPQGTPRPPAPRGLRPGRCGRGHCRRSAARAPRIAASPRAAAPPTAAASRPAPAAAWPTSWARCSACSPPPGRPSPAAAAARPGRPSTRCPRRCGRTTTRPAACATGPGTRAAPPCRAGLTTARPPPRPRTRAARRPPRAPLAGRA